MSIDGNLRPLFRRNLSTFFWSSIESYTEPGLPDSYYCRNSISGWIEFKIATANVIKSLTGEQVAWHGSHSRKGGRSFFFIRKGKTLYGFYGSDGIKLLNAGLAGPQPIGVWDMPWNWKEIEEVLLS